MYSDPAQWSRIRNDILNGTRSIRETSRKTGISRTTIKKMLDSPVPKPFVRRQTVRPMLGAYTATLIKLLHENETLPPSRALTIKEMYLKISNDGYTGSYGAVKDFIRTNCPKLQSFWEFAYDMVNSLDRTRGVEFLWMLSRAYPPILSRARAVEFLLKAQQLAIEASRPSKFENKRFEANQWMHLVIQNDMRDDGLLKEIEDLPEINVLLKNLYMGRLRNRNRALCVMAHHKGISSRTVCAFLAISRCTFRKYVKSFNEGGCTALFAMRANVVRKSDDEATKQAVFRILHEPPSKYGINRTSWIMTDLSRVLKDSGYPAGREAIRTITRGAGYKWRKARVALTSSDPNYSEKLEKIKEVLSNLKRDELFFSIDEFGPFAVKMKPGRMLMPPGEQRIVPQWQKSRGCLILTAALELSTNQVSHFYSLKKNTAEMIRMLELLLEKYPDRRTLYLSWDAASWHMSKQLQKRIDEHNDSAFSSCRPLIKLVPLPAGAQFLNVIESVFSGMARAIIHNSNYTSADEARIAIDRYLEERNHHFKMKPKRAGKKIWGEERVPAQFSDANNCKDPLYR